MLFFIYQSSQSPAYWIIATEDKRYIFSGPFLDVLKSQIKSQFMDAEFITVHQDISVNSMDYGVE